MQTFIAMCVCKFFTGIFKSLDYDIVIQKNYSSREILFSFIGYRLYVSWFIFNIDEI